MLRRVPSFAMHFSRVKAKESLDLDFCKWLKVHDEKQEKTRIGVMKSDKVQALSEIGKNTWSHMTLGDPYAEFQKDKAMHREYQGLASSSSAPQLGQAAPLAKPQPVPRVPNLGPLGSSRPAFAQMAPREPSRRTPSVSESLASSACSPSRRPPGAARAVAIRAASQPWLRPPVGAPGTYNDPPSLARSRSNTVRGIDPGFSGCRREATLKLG